MVTDNWLYNTRLLTCDQSDIELSERDQCFESGSVTASRGSRIHLNLL